MPLPHDAQEWQQSLNNEYGQNPYDDQDWHDPYETRNGQNLYDDQNWQNKTILPTMQIPPPPPLPYTPLPAPYMPEKTGFGAWSSNTKIATIFLSCLLIAFVCVLFIGVIGPGKSSSNAHDTSNSTQAPSATHTKGSSTVSTKAPSSVPTVASTQQPVTVSSSTTGGAQQNQSSPTACQAVNNNPWCYNFSPGSLIYNPQAAFCDYFTCVSTFWVDTSGYVYKWVCGRMRQWTLYPLCWRKWCLFTRRWSIAHTLCTSSTNTNTNSYTNTFADFSAYTDTYEYTCAYSNRYTYTDTYGYACANANRYANTNTNYRRIVSVGYGQQKKNVILL